MAERLQPYDVYWYEEPVMWDNASALAEVARAISLPVATGERLYTRWEFRDVLERNAARFIQPDIIHGGGIFEVRKIAAMAETYYVMVAPHNSNGPFSTIASVHLDACTPNAVIRELVVSRLATYNDMLTEPLVVEDGYSGLPDRPGWGFDLREDVEERYPAQMLPAIEEQALYYYE